MGSRSILVRLNELECPLIHPFAPVSVPVGETEGARFQVVGCQRIVKSPTTGIQRVPAQQMPSPFIFSVLAAIVLLFDKNVIQGPVFDILHLSIPRARILAGWIKTESIANAIAAPTVPRRLLSTSSAVARAVIRSHIFDVLPQGTGLDAPKTILVRNARWRWLIGQIVAVYILGPMNPGGLVRSSVIACPVTG